MELYVGDYSQALSYYQKAVSSEGIQKDVLLTSNNGIARMMMRLGDLVKGKGTHFEPLFIYLLELALQTKDLAVIRDCAVILESMKQFSDAADLYVQAQLFEKAAAIYISSRNFKSAAPLMKKISAPKLHAQYAKAKEAEGSFAEAVEAYEMAKDYDSVIRLNLNQLKNPQKAFAMVRKSRTAEGAIMVSQFCQVFCFLGKVIIFIELWKLFRFN